MNNRETIINSYLTAYNNFDVEGMLLQLDPQIVFKNITNGSLTLSLKGISEFKEQAIQALLFFKERTQKVVSFDHEHSQTTVKINYHAILAIDLPNGLKEGDVLNLTGESIFEFVGNKISSITDVS